MTDDQLFGEVDLEQEVIDLKNEIKFLRSFLVEKNLAEEYNLWKLEVEAVIIQKCYMDFPEETGHLKKSTQLSQRESFIDGRGINEKIEELRKLGYSDEYINKKLGHLVNWRI